MAPETQVRGLEEPIRILEIDGTVQDDSAVPDIDEGVLVTMYEQMRLARTLDERASTLHRQGRMGTYPPLRGQEAAQVASTHALAAEDWISYQYREHGTLAVRGLAPEYLLYWMGHEVGNEWLPERHVFPINISIGSHIPHATGLAWAAKLQGDDTVVACHFGDGATSEGDFHEGLNFAGVFDVPAVFVCNNNQYAISIADEDQTASETFAQKATAYGIDGVRVDGMDPLAVYEVTRQAVAKARDPSTDRGRPTMIEMVTYRLGPHTTVDDPSAYRDEEEVQRWAHRDPLPRLETFLRDRALLDDETIERIEREAEDRVADLVDGAEEYQVAEGDPASMFAHAYESETPRIAGQRAELGELRERHGDDALRQNE
ncbi:MAG: pyruvate dehydrogenase (acetyl-transferring) E1 component subunit alpha [Haloarculaceae archaeon]